MNYVIGIDLGTSATKTVLFNEIGDVIASASKEYPMYQPHNGWAEQEPLDWKNGVIETLAQVVKNSGVSKEQVKGIGISGQMHGLVMLDEDNRIIRPAIIWCDQRTAEECEEITDRVGAERLIEITANPALTGFTASKILWVRNHEPHNYDKLKHILLPKDYIRLILTGDYATDVSDASGMQLLDVPGRCWSEEILTKLEIDPYFLPKVYESVEVTGTLLPEIADRIGLLPYTVVVGGAGDNAAAAVGTGVVKDKKAFTTIGSSGVVYAHSNEITIDPKGRVHTFCCAVPGCWHVMGVTQGAGLSLKWFRDNFCGDYLTKAEEDGKDPYSYINQDVEEVPLGSNKLIYLPYLMGERTPHLDPDCRGVFFGLSGVHTRKDMLRGVMEGVSFSLKDCNDILVEMGIEVDEMFACGGGGKSKIWRQMLADMYECNVTTVTATEGSALGVAILASVGSGLYPNVEKACDIMIHRDKVCCPIPENSQKYNELHKIYKNLYQVLKGSFKELKKFKL